MPDHDFTIRNTAHMTERARKAWRDTPRWHFLARYERREHYLGWKRELDILRQVRTRG